MISPFWLHFAHFKRAPVTLMFLVANIFFYLLLPMKNGVHLSPQLTRKVSTREFISVQAFLYESYQKKNNPREWERWTRRFQEREQETGEHQIEDFWYQTSFRDGAFLKVVHELPPFPDPVRYQSWNTVFTEFESFQKKDFAGLFGVSLNGFRWSHYITYQFVHAGFLHLISNMIILILFGVLIEMQVGSVLVLFLYLCGGAVGGLFYSLTSGNNLAPLVGASGSVCALITFLLVTEPRQNLRFFYFFFPSEDYFGEIYLSKWWLIPLLILGDVNAVLTMPDWSLGVAHTAHLGAILFGMVIGGLYHLFSQKVDLGQTLSWVTHAEEAPVTLTEN